MYFDQIPGQGHTFHCQYRRDGSSLHFSYITYSEHDFLRISTAVWPFIAMLMCVEVVGLALSYEDTCLPVYAASRLESGWYQDFYNFDTWIQPLKEDEVYSQEKFRDSITPQRKTSEMKPVVNTCFPTQYRCPACPVIGWTCLVGFVCIKGKVSIAGLIIVSRLSRDRVDIFCRVCLP